mgnify:CR=1 FL=1
MLAAKRKRARLRNLFTGWRRTAGISIKLRAFREQRRMGGELEEAEVKLLALKRRSDEESAQRKLAVAESKRQAERLAALHNMARGIEGELARSPAH